MNAYLIPSNLDLDDLQSFLKSRNHRDGYYEKLLFVISTIITTHLRLKLKSSKFVQLHARTMMHYIGDHQFAKVMGYLQEREIVDVNPSYRFTSIPGEGWCKGYRLCRKYRTRYKEVEVPFYYWRKKERFKFNILASKTDLPESELPQSKFHENHLYLKTNHERIELVDCEILIDENLSDDEYDYRKFALQSIKKKEWYFVVGETSGRVTNNVSNFPKEFRQFLRLDGKPLVSVDISNCHPLLLSTLYQEESEEQSNYKRIVERGKFYKLLTNHLTKKYDTLPETKRKRKMKTLLKLKKSFAQYMNARVPALVRYKNCLIRDIVHAMDEMYPKLANEIIKRKLKGSLAKKLQRMESDLIIDAVVGELRRLGIVALTVHDSILCFAEDVGRVSNIIKSRCKEMYGLNPHLKTVGEVNLLDDDLSPMTQERKKTLEKLLEGL